VITPDVRFTDAVEHLVGEVEARTDAEVVVVVAARSGSYRDVAWLTAGATAFLVLLFLLFSPWSFAPRWIPLDLLLVGVATGWIALRAPALPRVFTRRARRRAQVEAAARSAFVEEAVHGTRRGTGILVYLSLLEGEVCLLRDLPLDGRIPPAGWSGLDLAPRDLDGFLALLGAVGRVLEAHVPPLEGDNPNEIANAPRVRR
jgi:putative membrane protein